MRRLLHHLQELYRGEEMSIIAELIYIGIVLCIGGTIKEEMKRSYPKVYNQYLEERAKMPWCRRIWYLK